MGTIFREKSMERISSPEQLNDYIRVSNPGVWLVLAAVFLLLAGVCVWGAFGVLETRLPVTVIVTDGRAAGYVSETDASSVSQGDVLRLEEKTYAVQAVPEKPEMLEGTMDPYFFHLSGFQEGDWVYRMDAGAVSVPDGIYTAQIVVDRESPVSFVMN